MLCTSLKFIVLASNMYVHLHVDNYVSQNKSHTLMMLVYQSECLLISSLVLVSSVVGYEGASQDNTIMFMLVEHTKFQITEVNSLNDLAKSC